MKDSRGFIWIGTIDGLNLYNGYDFRVFKHNPADSNSISDNFISTIIEDYNGNLWIGTQGGGLNKFNPAKEEFEVYLNDPSNKNSICSNFIFHHKSLHLDNDTILWIGTDNGLCNLNLKTGIFKHFEIDCQNSAGNKVSDVRIIFEDYKNRLWIGSDIGLIKFSKEDGTSLLYEKRKNEPKSISNNIITSIAPDKNNDRLWVGTEEGLNLFYIEDEQFIKYFNVSGKSNSLGDNSITSIITDKFGEIWIGTKSGGLNKYDASKNTFKQFKYDPSNPDGINDNYVDYLYCDDADILWIGTVNAGINMLDLKNKSFELIRNDPKNVNSLSYNTIRSIYEDKKGIIWIGTYGGGLNRYDGDHFIHYKHDPHDPGSLSHNIVSVILEDNLNNFWIGTWGGGLNKFDRTTGRFKQSVLDVPEFINDLYADDDNNLWIGSNRGLFIYKQREKKLFRLDSDTLNTRKLTASSINKILKDSYGNIWIGTWEGLNRIEMDYNSLSPDTIIQYKKGEMNQRNLSDNRIITIYEDSRKNLWLGTYASGLSRIDLKSIYDPSVTPSEFQYYTVEDGMPGNTIYGILEDLKGSLWLSTNNGLSKFDEQNEIFYNFDVDDGLQGNQFYWKAFLKNRLGKMYFGGTNGLNSFYPDSIYTAIEYPVVVITDLLLFNKTVNVGDLSFGRQILENSITVTKEIVLSRKDYSFSFEFTALTYKSQDKIRFRYKLENFDPDWIQTDSKRRYATYSHLRPGDYIFKVRSTNKNGLWNDEYTSLKITVLPAYWETIWAFLVYALIFILLLLYLRSQILARARYKHNIQLERFERERLEEYNDMKLRFFTNVSHEFRTPLTLILGPLEKLTSSEYTDKVLKQQLSFMRIGSKRLLRLINQILKFRKVETGNFTLNVSENDIIPFIREIAMSFKSQSVRNRINYSMKIPFKSAFVWFDKNIIETIVYNLLSNAFKFTKDKGRIRLTLGFYDSKDTPVAETLKDIRYLRIEISDSGSGIPKERLNTIFNRFYQIGKTEEQRRGTGIGLALCKDLVELHHGDIQVESEEDTGTTFVVTIPVHLSFFSDNEIGESGVDEENESQHPQEQFNQDAEIIFSDEDISNLKFRNPDIKNPSSILIIENDAELVKYIGKLLENKYKILCASDGESGLEMAYNSEPDLIISDIMMPGKDGFSLCENVKSDLRSSHIPVILLTALSSIDDRIRGLTAGADEYISKPFHPKHLLVSIQKLLEQRVKLKTYFQNQFSPSDDFSNLSSVDEEFMKKVTDCIEKYISESDLSVEKIGSEVGISSTHLYRKIKSLTGMSTNSLIRKIRLNKAAGMLIARQGAISQIMYEVGFSSHSYFASCFQKEYNMTPKEFISKNKNSRKAVY